MRARLSRETRDFHLLRFAFFLAVIALRCRMGGREVGRGRLSGTYFALFVLVGTCTLRTYRFIISSAVVIGLYGSLFVYGGTGLAF